MLASLLLGLYVLRFGPTLISARAIAAGEPRDAAAAPPRRLLVPLLLRMRLPVPLWLPFLHAAHEGQRLWRELDLDVRAIALGEPRPDERPPHPLAQALFVVLCARALLGDPLLLALGAQLVCAALCLRGALFEPPALLFAVLACCAPARQLAAAAAAPAAVALALVALLAHFFAALSAEGPLASSCNGTYGGPWECASQSECVAAALHLSAQPQPPREECIEGAVGVEPHLCDATDAANRQHSVLMAEMLLTQGLERYVIADVAFKPGCRVDVIEESQPLEVAKLLARAGKRVAIRDRAAIIALVRRTYGRLFEYETTDDAQRAPPPNLTMGNPHSSYQR